MRVRAAGVGPWDAWVRSGKSALPQPLPLTLGAEFAGVVEAIGEGVSGIAVGQPVFGATNARFTGAYAETAIADACRLALKPDRVSEIAAASTPVIAVTAWQALFEKAKVERGETVVIHGSAGGVGAFAVQLANAAGIKVIGTAKASDIPFVMTLGAEEAIDYRSERFESRAQNVDAVIDLVGGETQVRSFRDLEARRTANFIGLANRSGACRAARRGGAILPGRGHHRSPRTERRHARVGGAFGGHRRRSAARQCEDRPRDARRNSPEAARQARAQHVRSNQSAIVWFRLSRLHWRGAATSGLSSSGEKWTCRE